MNWSDTRFGRLVANSLPPRRPSEIMPRLGVCLYRSFVRLFVYLFVRQVWVRFGQCRSCVRLLEPVRAIQVWVCVVSVSLVEG